MISIAYISSRLDPRFDLFVDSVCGQLDPGDQVIFIDHFLDYIPNRRSEFIRLVDDRFKFLHLPPKPSIWRGVNRKTRRDFCDVAGARNTAIIVAEHDHIVFLDDLSAVSKKWKKFHTRAQQNKRILCGQFRKVDGLKVSPQGRISFRKVTVPDGRVSHGAAKCGGGWVFGSNASYPTEWLLKVNGFDEYTARRGCEDCNLGVRLENAGFSDNIYYDPRSIVYEDDWYHWCGPNTCYYDGTFQHSTLRRFKTEGPDNWTIYKRMEAIEQRHLYEDKKFWTLATACDLDMERKLWKETATFRQVEHDTFIDYDGQLLEDI